MNIPSHIFPCYLNTLYNSPNLPGLLPKSSQGSLGPTVLLSLLFPVKYGLRQDRKPYILRVPDQNGVSQVWYRGFLTRMVYFYYISCARYTILVGNPRYIVEIHHSGREPSICKNVTTVLNRQRNVQEKRTHSVLSKGNIWLKKSRQKTETYNPHTLSFLNYANIWTLTQWSWQLLHNPTSCYHNHNYNGCISVVSFHVKHAKLHWTSTNTKNKQTKKPTNKPKNTCIL